MNEMRFELTSYESGVIPKSGCDGTGVARPEAVMPSDGEPGTEEPVGCPKVKGPGWRWLCCGSSGGGGGIIGVCARVRAGE